MTTTISITKRGQLHIPKKMREIMGWDRPLEIQIKQENNKIILEPINSKIDTLIKKYEKKQIKSKINLDKVRDYIDYSDL